MNFVSFLLAYSTVFIWQQIYALHILHQCGFAKDPALRASFHKKSRIRSIRSIADIAGYSFILLPRHKSFIAISYNLDGQVIIRPAISHKHLQSFFVYG